jgi:hypothetical protein
VLDRLRLFLVEVLKVSLRAFGTQHSWQAAAFLGVFPAMLFSLAIENILADAGGPGGTGYVLVLGALIPSVLQTPLQGTYADLRRNPAVKLPCEA